MRHVLGLVFMLVMAGCTQGSSSPAAATDLPEACRADDLGRSVEDMIARKLAVWGVKGTGAQRPHLNQLLRGLYAGQQEPEFYGLVPQALTCAPRRRAATLLAEGSMPKSVCDAANPLNPTPANIEAALELAGVDDVTPLLVEAIERKFQQSQMRPSRLGFSDAALAECGVMSPPGSGDRLSSSARGPPPRAPRGPPDGPRPAP